MKFSIPGALWVALITGLIPVVQQVITRFYPEASYAWSALAVTALGVVLKAIQVAVESKPQIIDTQRPAATPRGGPPDGDDYTYVTVKQPSKLARVILG